MLCLRVGVDISLRGISRARFRCLLMDPGTLGVRGTTVDGIKAKRGKFV